MDRIYFNCPCAPDGSDSLECVVRNTNNGLVSVDAPVHRDSYLKKRMEFPMTNVYRIEYGTQIR
jgi:hypothetical protein